MRKHKNIKIKPVNPNKPLVRWAITEANGEIIPFTINKSKNAAWKSFCEKYNIPLGLVTTYESIGLRSRKIKIHFA